MNLFSKKTEITQSSSESSNDSRKQNSKNQMLKQEFIETMENFDSCLEYDITQIKEKFRIYEQTGRSYLVPDQEVKVPPKAYETLKQFIKEITYHPNPFEIKIQMQYDFGIEVYVGQNIDFTIEPDGTISNPMISLKSGFDYENGGYFLSHGEKAEYYEFNHFIDLWHPKYEELIASIKSKLTEEELSVLLLDQQDPNKKYKPRENTQHERRN